MAFLLLVSLVVLCLGSVQGGFDFCSSKNVSGITASGWNYRTVSLDSFNTPFYLGANYLSVSVNKTDNTADVISGSFYVTPGNTPFAFISYFETSLGWNLPASAGPDAYATSTSVSAAGGYVGTVYLRIDETLPNGTVVASQSLRSAISRGDSGLTWTLTDQSKPNSTLQYVTLTGTTTASNLSVAITFLASSVAGVLNQGYTVVGPKAFESVVNITNWPYKDLGNNISLVIGVGTGDVSFSSSQRSVFSKNSTSQVYFSLSGQVTVGGVVKPAQTKFSANSTVNIDHSNFLLQLLAKYGSDATYNVVTVSFPAGASDIVYDPAIGEGASMTETATIVTENPTPSSASKSAAALLVGAVALLAALL